MVPKIYFRPPELYSEQGDGRQVVSKRPTRTTMPTIEVHSYATDQTIEIQPISRMMRDRPRKPKSSFHGNGPATPNISERLQAHRQKRKQNKAAQSQMCQKYGKLEGREAEKQAAGFSDTVQD